MSKQIILVGGGGHCKACIDVIECEGNYKIVGIVDVPNKLHQKILGYEIIAVDDDLPRLSEEYSYFLITVGQIKSPDKRKKLFTRLKKLQAHLPSIVSPLAYVSKHSVIGEGTIIMHDALVNANVRIGENCIINSKALIEHDVTIANHCHISTKAVINGGATIDSCTFVGSSAVTDQGVNIGKNCVIASNIRIKTDIPSGSFICQPPM